MQVYVLRDLCKCVISTVPIFPADKPARCVKCPIEFVAVLANWPLHQVFLDKDHLFGRKQSNLFLWLKVILRRLFHSLRPYNVFFQIPVPPREP